MNNSQQQPARPLLPELCRRAVHYGIRDNANIMFVANIVKVGTFNEE